MKMSRVRFLPPALMKEQNPESMQTDGKPWTVSVKRYCFRCGWPVLSTKAEYKAWGQCHAPWGPCGAKAREAHETHQRHLAELNARWERERHAASG